MDNTLKLISCGTVAIATMAAMSFGFLGGRLPLNVVADVPLPGGATRFDYESLDSSSGRLYIAHMGDGAIVVFNTRTRRVEATITGIPLVRGVLAVPQLHRVFAASEGNAEVEAIDARTNRILARVPAGNVDGLAFDPTTKRIFVSDEAGRRDVVIDATRPRVVGSIALGGEAGNTVYDAGSGHIFVAVQTSNELAEIDPVSVQVVARYPLPGSTHSHGVALNERTRFAYIAGEQNASVVAFDLRAKKIVNKRGVGVGVDVLSVDPGLGRLYVASESGVVSVFNVAHGRLQKLGQSLVAFNAHVVVADPKTHLVYFPLRGVGAKPTLRIMQPSKEVR